MSARLSRNVTGIRQRRKEGHPWPPGRPEGGRSGRPLGSLRELHQPGDAPCWEDSARRPGFSERPEGVLWDSPGRDGSTTPPHRSGRVVDAADGPQSPLVASLLPLAVRAGALALAGVEGPPYCTARSSGRRRSVDDPAAPRFRPWRCRRSIRAALLLLLLLCQEIDGGVMAWTGWGRVGAARRGGRGVV